MPQTLLEWHALHVTSSVEHLTTLAHLVTEAVSRHWEVENKAVIETDKIKGKKLFS